MTPGHPAETCFLRSIHFRPHELNQRINLYNQQHGDKPPPGTILPKWNPKTPPADQSSLDKQPTSRDKLAAVSNQKKSFRPFTNTPTKTTTSKPSVNFVDVEDPEISDEIHPSISMLFENETVSSSAEISNADLDKEYSSDESAASAFDFKPVISAFVSQERVSRSVEDPRPVNFHPNFTVHSTILKQTPSKLLILIKQYLSKNKKCIQLNKLAIGIENLSS